MAMWTMLGARPVTTLAWESFGEGWVTDAAKQLKLDPTIIRADYGQLPDLNGVNFAHDRSEEHTSELQSLMRISYAVFCLKKNSTYTERRMTNILVHTLKPHATYQSLTTRVYQL